MAEMSKHDFKKICEMQIKMKVAYCYLCGQPILNINDYNIDHVQPRSRQGRDDPSNWKIAHKTPCNSHKGALNYEEYYLFNALDRVRKGVKNEEDLEILQRLQGIIQGIQFWGSTQRKK